MSLLQQHPPPVDYQARRTHADQLEAFTTAIEGGAYAPASLRLGADSPDYAAFRRQLAVRDADLFHVAHQRLQRSLQQTGPAAWTPPATFAKPSGLT